MIRHGRYSAEMPETFALFLIGMRINEIWKPHKWIPVACAMPKMLQELTQDQKLGYLGGEIWYGRTIIAVQYWRSFDHLISYAQGQDNVHLGVWRHFNRIVASCGSVGIWHGAYVITAGNYENTYVNMQPFGLGKIGELNPSIGKRESPPVVYSKKDRGSNVRSQW
jgi:hypothetical protein